MKATDLMKEMRIAQTGDWWSDSMGWFFAVASEMYERGLDIPAEWQYRPGAASDQRDPDLWETEICAAATDEGLLIFGRAMHRYLGILKKAGLDY